MTTLFGEPQKVTVTYFGGPQDGANQQWPLPLPNELHVPIPVVASVLDSDPDPAPYEMVGVYLRERGTYRYRWVGYR